MALRWRFMAAMVLPLLLGCPGSRGPGDARDLLSTLPAEVDLVTFADVQALLSHPLWSKVEDDPFLRPGQETLAQFQQITGVDPLRDLQMLLFAARGLGRPEMEMVLVARGTFDRRRIEGLLAQSGFQPSRDGPLTLHAAPAEVELPADMPGLPSPNLAFLDDYTLALGSRAMLASIAATQTGVHPRLMDSTDLGPLVEEGLGSGQFWGAFRSGYLADQLRERIEDGIPLLGVLKGFSGVQVLRFSMRFSDSIDLVARARAATEEDARLLADTLNGFLALAKLVAKDKPELLRFLEGALVGLDLESVRLSMNLDGATLELIRHGWLQDLGADR